MPASITLTNPLVSGIRARQLGGPLTLVPSKLSVSNSMGYYSDSLSVEFDLEQGNRWGITDIRQLPRLLELSCEIDGTTFEGFYARNLSSTNANGVLTVTTQGVRIDAGALAHARLRNQVIADLSATLDDNKLQLQAFMARHSALQQPDYASTVAILNDFGYGIHATGSTFEVFPLNTLWLRDRDKGPFKSVSTTPVGASDIPVATSIPDSRIRHNYNGRELYTTIHAGQPGVTHKIRASDGLEYSPPSELSAVSLFPAREVPGIWPNQDAGLARLRGELDRIRFESIRVTIQLDLDPTITAGRIIQSGLSYYVVLATTHDVAAYSTTCQCMVYLAGFG